MNVEDVVRTSKILEFKVGSKLYGTDTPKSDTDFSGIFIAPKEYYLGLRKVEEVDFSIISKLDSGRNDTDAIDRKFYELRKFVKLASENNPNIIEQLFINSENIIFANSLGQKLLDNKHLFPYKGAHQKFIGYAISQKKKMIIKRDNMQGVLMAIEFLSKLKPKSYVAEYSYDQKPNVVEKEQHIMFGDCNVQKNDTVAQALRKLNARREKFSSRFDDYVSKSGYDVKFASHLIRLLYEGIELLQTGEIQFPLKKRGELLDIKNGKFTIEEVLELSEHLEDEFRDILETSDLPSKPQIEKIENLLIEMVEESWEFK